MKPDKYKPPKQFRPATCTGTTDYTDDEREFLVAMDRYKREKNRPFPTWREVLMVIKGLGYTK
jgi:hypothetical protein